MNSKHCHVAQCVLGIIFRSQDPDDLAKFPGVKDILEGLMPYTGTCVWSLPLMGYYVVHMLIRFGFATDFAVYVLHVCKHELYEGNGEIVLKKGE